MGEAIDRLIWKLAGPADEARDDHGRWTAGGDLATPSEPVHRGLRVVMTPAMKIAYQRGDWPSLSKHVLDLVDREGAASSEVDSAPMRLGEHWSSSEQVAKKFSSASRSDVLSVVVSGRYDRSTKPVYNPSGYARLESERTLRSGTPIEVSRVQVQTPSGWTPIFTGRRRTQA